MIDVNDGIVYLCLVFALHILYINQVKKHNSVNILRGREGGRGNRKWGGRGREGSRAHYS